VRAGRFETFIGAQSVGVSSFRIFAVLYLGILSMALISNCPYPRALTYFYIWINERCHGPLRDAVVYAFGSLLRPLNKQWPQFLILVAALGDNGL